MIIKLFNSRIVGGHKVRYLFIEGNKFLLMDDKFQVYEYRLSENASKFEVVYNSVIYTKAFIDDKYHDDVGLYGGILTKQEAKSRFIKENYNIYKPENVSVELVYKRDFDKVIPVNVKFGDLHYMSDSQTESNVINYLKEWLHPIISDMIPAYKQTIPINDYLLKCALPIGYKLRIQTLYDQEIEGMKVGDPSYKDQWELITNDKFVYHMSIVLNGAITTRKYPSAT